MILLDSRVGSKELLSKLPKGLAELAKLEYGDAAFIGRGPEETPIAVGVERKDIGDLIQSMTSGRLSNHQLPGMLASYDVCYLVVEGIWKAGPDGYVELYRWSANGFVTYPIRASAIYNYMTTLESLGGLRIRQARIIQDTADIIRNLHTWWTGKSWEEHTSHIDVPKTFDPGERHTDLGKPSLLCRVAAQLPGIGPTRARAVSRHFSSILGMCLANQQEWGSIEGVGKTTADRVVKSICEESKE